MIFLTTNLTVRWHTRTKFGVTCCFIMCALGSVEGLVAKGPQSHAFIPDSVSFEWDNVRASAAAAGAHRLWHLATYARWGCRRTQHRAAMAEWHLNHVVSIIYLWTTVSDVEPAEHIGLALFYHTWGVTVRWVDLRQRSSYGGYRTFILKQLTARWVWWDENRQTAFEMYRLLIVGRCGFRLESYLNIYSALMRKNPALIVTDNHLYTCINKNINKITKLSCGI